MPSGDGAGRVIEFDVRRGLGTVESRDGVRHRFHCTRIADGNRTVAVGTDVRYEVTPGPLGRWEAVSVSPV